MMLSDNPAAAVVLFEKRSGLMQATKRKFVDGTVASLKSDAKPREELARLVTDPEKPYLAQTQVNRTWGHFFGYGFTRPVDDMGPHNPPSHPELLTYMAKEFQRANYDQKRLIRWITLSEAYNLTSRFNDGNDYDNPAAGETPLFSHMYVKTFSAEQLYDSLIIATEAHKVNRDSDRAEQQRQSWLQQFVQTFGTDENDDFTTFNGTIPQALVMMNGALTNSAISGENGGFLQRVLDSPNGKLRSDSSSKKKSTRRPNRTRLPASTIAARNRSRNIPEKIETLFMVALARKPTEEELNAINETFQKNDSNDPIQGMQDVFWAILNSNEFILNH